MIITAFKVTHNGTNKHTGRGHQRVYDANCTVERTNNVITAQIKIDTKTYVFIVDLNAMQILLQFKYDHSPNTMHTMFTEPLSLKCGINGAVTNAINAITQCEMDCFGHVPSDNPFTNHVRNTIHKVYEM